MNKLNWNKINDPHGTTWVNKGTWGVFVRVYKVENGYKVAISGKGNTFYNKKSQALKRAKLYMKTHRGG